MMSQEKLREEYKLALIALTALRKIDHRVPKELKTQEDVSTNNLAVTHQFAIQNTENLAKRLQAAYQPGAPWHERKV